MNLKFGIFNDLLEFANLSMFPVRTGSHIVEVVLRMPDIIRIVYLASSLLESNSGAHYPA